MLRPIHSEDKNLLINLLEQQQAVVNEVSTIQFDKKLKSLSILHEELYYPVRKKYPNIPSQVIIKSIRESDSIYKSIKSNKHKVIKPFEKRNLCLRLDKRIYSRTKIPTRINIITTEKRKEFDIIVYPKLKKLMDKYEFQDPLVFVRNEQLMISLSFDIKTPKINPSKVLGVDLGIRRAASCSDGRLIIDKKFNKEKREIRYLKRQLQSKKTKSAHRHLRKIKHKERNKNKNQTHLISNEILKTDANVIALENLKGIKAKKHKLQNKNPISQVPLFDLRRIIEYKAINMGKHICLVSPAYTSQIDSRTGKKEGERKGCRFYSKTGLIYDADLNAAHNIAHRSKLPFSYGNILDGQGIVNCPNACKSLAKAQVL